MGDAERLLTEEGGVALPKDKTPRTLLAAAEFVESAVPSDADAGTAVAATAAKAKRATREQEESGGGGAGTDGAAPKGDEGAGAAAPSDYCQDDGEATKGGTQAVVTATAAKARALKRATRKSKGGSGTDAANSDVAGTTPEGDETVVSALEGGDLHGAAAVGGGDAVREGAAATGHARGAILGADEGSREQLTSDELRATVALEATGGGSGRREDKRGRIREYAAQSFLGANLCAVTEAGLAGVSKSWEDDQRWKGWGFAISETLSYTGNTLLLSWDADRFTRLEPERKWLRWRATSLAGAFAVKLLDNVTGVVLWHVGAHLEKKNVERRAEQCMQLENIARALLEEEGECSADALLLSADLNEDLPMEGAQRAARYPSLPSFAATIKEPTVGKVGRHRRVIDQIMTHDASLRLGARGAHVFQELGGAQEWLDHNPVTVRLDHVE